jgi:ribosomal protein L5
MSNEQFERKMEFIVDTLAQVAVNDQKHEMRLSRLERIAKLMVGAGLRERRTRSDADQRLTKALAELAQSQAELTQSQKETQASIRHSDSRLDALIDVVRKQQHDAS